MLFFRATLLTATLLALPWSAQALELPPNDGFLTDAAGILTTEQEAQVEAALQAYQQETSNEVAIVILPSMSGADIAQMAVEIGRKWGVGTEKDNGVLMLIAYEDREMFLATGYGLEGAIPDIIAKGIIEEDVVPNFREARYAEGLLAALDAIRKHAAGEYTADRYTHSSEDTPGFAWLLLLVLMFLQGGTAWLAQSKSWWLGGVLGGIGGFILTFFFGWWLTIPLLVVIGLVYDYLVSKWGKQWSRGRHSRYWGGPGSGGGSSGGFGGFGGGSFGGGGARGRW